MAVKVTAKCDTCGTVVFPSWKYVHQIPDELPCPICKGTVIVLTKEYVPVDDFPVTQESIKSTVDESNSTEEPKYGKTRKGYR